MCDIDVEDLRCRPVEEPFESRFVRVLLDFAVIARMIFRLFAVIFTFIFGDQSPFAYALSATFTIILCTKLNLHVGTTVATLTAMAMIPGIHEAYFFNFFSNCSYFSCVLKTNLIIL